MTALAQRAPGVTLAVKDRPVPRAQRWDPVTLLRILNGLRAYQPPDRPATAAASDMTAAATLGIVRPCPSWVRPYVLTRRAGR